MPDFSVDVLIRLEGAELTADWWAERFYWAIVRSGGLPPEIPGPDQVQLGLETDSHGGDEYLRVTFPLPAGLGPGRARELSHLLTSIFAAEGYTLRRDGKAVDPLLVGGLPEPTGTLGALDHAEARVCAGGCLDCVMSSETRYGCCTQGASFSLADIGTALLQGHDQFVADCLALPGQIEGEKWHPHLRGGICHFHDPSRGCTLATAQMPLQCRTYLCAPERLLPPEVHADYQGYVDALEEAEGFVEDQMRNRSGVDFDSPLPELKAAAAKAFQAWRSCRA